MGIFNMAGGAVAGGIWKVAAIALGGLLVVGGGAGGTALSLASSARDTAVVELKAEQRIVAALRAGVDLQNTRIVELGKEKLAAEARGAAARQIAAAKGRRYDAALAAAGARAATCDEAMPAVNQLLKDVK
ncbi:hypothetical protein SAMN05428959_1011127 [Duganella sp. CF517]|uniref:hypothetical protein n=1 Tax=Duganella sp. CF517 TaxID=1881038 RepID=UPI0008BC5501|nr:hypothetical protein [Duganella sp. CF517]SEN31174.1 hypothetical protein SAMN05428959_1011127 [Duganella sp. CF517]